MATMHPSLKPAAAFALCASVGCDNQAKSRVLHQPDDEPPIYVPFCDQCIDARVAGGRLEYEMTVSGFIGQP